MFEKHRKAVEIGGTPYVRIEAARGYADGETIDAAEVDWSGETLVCKISPNPGAAATVTLTDVTVVVVSKTWQDYKDDCVPRHYFPCGVDYSASIDVSEITIGWTNSDFDLIPPADNLGEPVELYMEVCRADGTGPRFIAGDFIMTEIVR